MLKFNFELSTRLVAMVTDAGVEHFGSMLASVPYIWTELRHVLKGLTPTCVNKNLEKFLALLRPLRASSVLAVVFAQHGAPTYSALLINLRNIRHALMAKHMYLVLQLPWIRTCS